MSERRSEVRKRVARIHGHVHAISEMLDEGRPYGDVVHQIVAVRSALDSTLHVIIDDLVEACEERAGKDSSMEESLTELRQVVGKLRSLG
ncbi:MAG: metal-sensitive transcriptional regulator [Nitrososphaerota archaeon]|nr:metal-sensitive transcriptional regulator [Nitrososphaerota archaeon]MDG6966797.1 metal-sensitive transcriptional regulator [Nitrososphaerota archaeon]MDG6977957.1 metal-sensitive transcriptional regulator [Nitrososphaerota archaeon]MDG7006085.1 metal-sensitive transcriptional regulator [Nitrososphaerota archaeon]MDG7021360.1 metal-sensitive transcriptional regulator [Nitrososphaerota archaeon]